MTRYHISTERIVDPDTGAVSFNTTQTPYTADEEAAADAADAAASVVTVDMVAAERNRRLALGFHYNFNDSRGIHLIGTTDEDMKGWREVTDSAQAEINLGNPNGAFTTIVTNTGPATITAMEWQAILRAAKIARDPFWQTSFTLEAMSPIPADYAADSRWPAQP